MKNIWFIGLLLSTSIIVSSCGESLDDKPLSKQSYSEWKEYMDNGFKEWYNSGTEMSNSNLKEMYISSAWKKEDQYEQNIQEFASLSQSQKDELKQYANNTCKQYVSKIGEAWNRNSQ